MNSNLKLNDWITGKVTINGTCYVKSPGQTPPRIVETTDFSKCDQESIKNEQKKLFDKLANSFLLDFKSKFLENYERSELKTIHLKKEKQQVRDILYLNPNNDKPILWYWNSSFIESNLISIQDHIIKYKLKGLNLDYSFMNSDQSPYSWKEKPHIEILAEALFQYHNWLVIQDKTTQEKNNWSKECYDLFNFLHENYQARTIKKKYQTIYFYLTERAKGNQAFNSIRKNYIKTVKEKVSGFDVTKINRPNDFEDQAIVISDLINRSRSPN